MHKPITRPTPIMTESTKQTSRPNDLDGFRKKKYRAKRPRIVLKNPNIPVPTITALSVDTDCKSD